MRIVTITFENLIASNVMTFIFSAVVEDDDVEEDNEEEEE